MRPSWSSLLCGCLGGGSVAALKVRPSFTAKDLPARSDPGCLHVFTFAELSTATGGFGSGSGSNLIGVGVYGSVYKGFVEDDDGGAIKPPVQAVAFRRIDRRHAALRRQDEEPLEEAILLGKLRHPNLVKMIGYCREEAEQLAVYEYMAHGSLDNHLLRRRASYFATDLQARLNIAIGVAKGLSFLHDANEKPFIHGDLESSNILLDLDYNTKLLYERLPKDYFLVGGCRGGMSVGFAAAARCRSPEYYSIADSLTERTTCTTSGWGAPGVAGRAEVGRRSADGARTVEERNLVEFARACLGVSPRMVARIMDPVLEGRYPVAAAQKMAMVAYKCLDDKPKKRPDMVAVVQMLELLPDVAKGWASQSGGVVSGAGTVVGGEKGGVEHEGHAGS